MPDHPHTFIKHQPLRAFYLLFALTSTGRDFSSLLQTWHSTPQTSNLVLSQSREHDYLATLTLRISQQPAAIGTLAAGIKQNAAECHDVVLEMPEPHNMQSCFFGQG